MVVIAIFVIGPILQSLWMSLHDWSFLSPDQPFVGAANYSEALQDPRFWNAVRVTLIYTIWKNLGFNMVILLAGLQGIPEVNYDAAAVDGAGRWARFRHITLPGLRHTLLFTVVISVIASLQVFDQVYVMTRGGPVFSTESLVTYMYHEGFQLFRMGFAAALASILFAMIMCVSVAQLVLFRYRDVD
jgi:ABC-type sugar transport system permease subunit